MQFWGNQFLQGLSSWEDLRTWTARGFTSLTQILNGKVMFSDNMFCQIVDISATTTSSNRKFEHTLGVVPIGYLVITTSSPGTDLTVGTTAWTNTAIYLSGSFPTHGTMIIIGA